LGSCSFCLQVQHDWCTFLQENNDWWMAVVHAFVLSWLINQYLYGCIISFALPLVSTLTKKLYLQLGKWSLSYSPYASIPISCTIVSNFSCSSVDIWAVFLCLRLVVLHSLH
jgi:hypothetical protein